MSGESVGAIELLRNLVEAVRYASDYGSPSALTEEEEAVRRVFMAIEGRWPTVDEMGGITR